MTTFAYHSLSESSWPPASLLVTQSMMRLHATAPTWRHCLRMVAHACNKSWIYSFQLIFYALHSDTSSSFSCSTYWEGPDLSFHKVLHFYLSAQLSISNSLCCYAVTWTSYPVTAGITQTIQGLFFGAWLVMGKHHTCWIIIQSFEIRSVLAVLL